MTKYTYKAKNGLDFFVPGVGESTDGVLVTDRLLESPSLELMKETESEQEQPAAQPPVQSTTPAAQPGAVIGVAPQATQPTPAPVPVNPQPTNNQEQN